MDGIIQFLVIVGIIAFGVIHEYKKEAQKNAGKKPVIPQEEEEQEVFVPRPFNPFERETSIPQPDKARTKKNRKTPRPFLADEEAVRTTASSTTSPAYSSLAHPSALPADNAETEAASEFTIRSAEEARKAIIWGEILQRKY
ncbi:MAG: hypothetical protein LBL97_04695 [Prevotellaceae bacterium]|jgi:hypothetical protein|nr:hypothetical protein [Prevotellaceae bacterium]